MLLTAFLVPSHPPTHPPIPYNTRQPPSPTPTCIIQDPQYIHKYTTKQLLPLHAPDGLLGPALPCGFHLAPRPPDGVVRRPRCVHSFPLVCCVSPLCPINMHAHTNTNTRSSIFYTHFQTHNRPLPPRGGGLPPPAVHPRRHPHLRPGRVGEAPPVARPDTGGVRCVCVTTCMCVYVCMASFVFRDVCFVQTRLDGTVGVVRGSLRLLE